MALTNASKRSRYFCGQYSRSCDSSGPMWVSDDTSTRLSTPGSAPTLSCSVATMASPYPVRRCRSHPTYPLLVTYTVERVLGRGATAVVELAHDAAGRSVAVKRLALHGSAAEIDRARRRIRREAEVLQRVRHPGVVPLLAVEDDGTDVVLITCYAGGGSLRDRVRAGGPLSVREVSAIARPL